MPRPISKWSERLRDNPYTCLWGWLVIGQWVPMYRARVTFRRAWDLKPLAFRAAIVLAAVAFALAYVFILLMLTMRGIAGAGTSRGSPFVFGIMLSSLAVGIIYHLIMRIVLRKEFLRVRHADGEPICTNCGYSTEGLTPNNSGTTSCPECGAPTPPCST